MLTHSDRTKITSNGKEVAWFRCCPAKCHTSLLMVEIVPLLKSRPPFPHLIEKKGDSSQSTISQREVNAVCLGLVFHWFSLTLQVVTSL